MDGQAGVKANFFQPLVVGRVGNGNEQVGTAFDQRQQIVFADQFFRSRIPDNILQVKSGKIKRWQAKLFPCGQHQLFGIDKIIFQQVARQGFLFVVSCCLSLMDGGLTHYLVGQQAGSQPGQRFICHNLCP